MFGISLFEFGMAMCGGSMMLFLSFMLGWGASGGLGKNAPPVLVSKGLEIMFSLMAMFFVGSMALLIDAYRP